jgi:hypothetical protein
MPCLTLSARARRRRVSSFEENLSKCARSYLHVQFREGPGIALIYIIPYTMCLLLLRPGFMAAVARFCM